MKRYVEVPVENVADEEHQTHFYLSSMTGQCQHLLPEVREFLAGCKYEVAVQPLYAGWDPVVNQPKVVAVRFCFYHDGDAVQFKLKYL